MNLGPRIRVLLAVRNQLLRKSLAQTIRQRSDIELIGQPSELSNVAQAIAKSEGGLALLDSASASALHRQGFTRMRDLSPNTDVLLVGMDTDERAFLRAVRAGVSGYLLHEASAGDVIAAIRAVARGEAVFPSQFSKALFNALAGLGTFTPRVQRMGLQLTRREQELLPMVAGGLTNKEIASLLNLSQQTVKNHVHRMLRKIGADDRTKLAEIARAEDLAN